MTDKQQALGTLTARYGTHGIAWSEVDDTFVSPVQPIYAAEHLGDCWFVKFGLTGDEFRLRSTRVLAISRVNGEVLYDGDLNDEG